MPNSNINCAVCHSYILVCTLENWLINTSLDFQYTVFPPYIAILHSFTQYIVDFFVFQSRKSFASGILQ